LTIKKLIPEPVKQAAGKLLLPIPAHLRKNHVQIDADGVESIRKSLQEKYHIGWRSPRNYSKKGYEKDLNDHLRARLEEDRQIVVPWLDDARSLADCTILEIGCGTGSSTVALAEQGATVTGVDIDEGALAVAKDRCRVYGLEADFRLLNAGEISNTFAGGEFDVIIFFACLEHMTVRERLASLKDAWEMLPAGGLLVVVETPNRLWYYDNHTAKLRFFHWLPNELAFRYSRFSPRENFGGMYDDYNETTKEHFLRRGRGISFHEFELAIKPAQELKVVSSLSTYQGIRYSIRKKRLDRKFKSILKRIYPEIHEGFLDDLLYLVIEKE